MSYVDAKTAQNIDNKLMSTPGFSIDQLMELAGLSVAQATHDFYTQTYKNPLDATSRKVLVFCGPGNNGGDGLVAARHLKHFGYTPSIVYPKQGKGDLFINLVKQCIDLDIEISRHEPSVVDYKSFNMVVDALFGFSFQGPIREPFGAIIQRFAQEQVPVISVDIPSGWDVDNGDTYNTGFDPDAVISLTLPKLCMQQYRKTHYVGGRFVPPSLALELGLTMPDYGYGPAQIIKVSPEVAKPVETMVVMYTSAPSMEEAKKIASNLVSNKLAACVNIIPQILSVYEWKGNIENGEEFLLMIKTRKSLASEVSTQIKSIHSYELPESIALDISNEGSSPAFLNWIGENTNRQPPSAMSEKSDR